MAAHGSDPRLHEAKQADIFAMAKKCGAVLKGGNEAVGPCPVCGGTDRFSVNRKQGVFNCRGSNAGGKGDGGDVITMVMHCQGLDFPGALEFITGRPSERRERDPKPQQQRRESSQEEPPWNDAPPPTDERDYGAAAAPSKEDSKKRDEELMWAAIRGEPAKTYRYCDADHIERYQVVRFEWKDSAGKRQKTFFQRRKPRPMDPPEIIKRGWVWKLDDAESIPFRLPELMNGVVDGELVFISEGEKDAETLAAWGLTATTFLAAGKRMPPSLDVFQGADVVLLQDNDPQSADNSGRLRFHTNGQAVIAGRDFVQKIGRALKGVARRIRVMEFPDLPLKGDVTDWRDLHGGDAPQLFERLESAHLWAPLPPISKFGAVGWMDMDTQGPSVDWLIDDMFTTGDKSIIGGASGSGKTFFAMGAGICIARGTDFLGHKVKQGLVLYQAGESGRGVIGRAKAYRKHFGIPHSEDVPFRFLTKRVDLFAADGNVQEFINECKAWQEFYVDDPLRVIFIDTLAKASIGAEENSSKEMGIVLDNIDKINVATGAAVVVVHHMNADGKKLRGSTAIYSNVEQVAAISMDPETKIRTMIMDKVKDGESGRQIKFELLAVNIGHREDGKEITSCVVLPLGEKAAHNGAEARRGFALRGDAEDLPFRALLSALAEYGQAAPGGMQLPASVRVVDAMRWKDEFAKLTAIPKDDGDPRAFEVAVHAALKAASGKFIRFGLIKRSNPWVWLAGKPVNGFPSTFPDKPAAEYPVHNTTANTGYDPFL